MSGVIINKAVKPTASNPHSWMPLIGDPPNVMPAHGRVLFGVLRPLYRGFAPSAATLARTKLTVAAVADTPDWTQTAHRAEVLLPREADDRLLDPRTLFEEWEAACPADTRSLATYVTLTWQPSRLHDQWEIGRALFRGLVTEFGMAVLLVQHAPSKAGSASCPHLHAVIPGPRRLTPWGFAEPIDVLASDKGRQLIVDRLIGLRGQE